ncbi:hypothetical protein ACFL6S_37510 [Candidatus Poribacteria bacterium]
MLVVKGIYDGDQIKLLDPVNMSGRHIVEIRFIGKEVTKEQQLAAFRKARGIWKDRPEVDTVFKELNGRWQQWRKDLEECV